MKTEQSTQRRYFLKTSGLLGAGFLVPNLNFACTPSTFLDGNIHQFGKRAGYADQISILVSMMDWMRATVLRSVKGISQKELDFLLDGESNSIGAMLMHLAATERYYQIHTFEGKEWGDFDKKDTDLWNVGSRLGERARKEIKGHPISYYMDKLEEVREYSLRELKNRDDNWLMQSTPLFGNQPTNNYCKWFHVVEHESNHNGQIKYIKSRVV
ncbi:MAG: DinB family protein [Maribacter sp.]|nr:DinB family protein [Maribacter sp.]